MFLSGILFFLPFAHLLPDSLLRKFYNLTGTLVALFSNAIGITALYQNGFVTVSGFRMHISLECTAIHYLAILTAGILAYPGYNLRYKMKSIFIGSLSIMLFNVLRIIFIGIIGSNLPSMFDFSHTYLWQGTFAVIVFFIYLIWVKRSFISKPSLRFLGTCLLSSAIAVIILDLLMEPYVRFLAGITDRLMLLTQTDLYVSDRLMLWSLTSSLYIKAIGDKILFTIGGEVLLQKFSVDIFDSAVFIGLMTASVITIPCSSKLKALRSFSLGAMILISFYILEILTLGFFMREGVSRVFISNVMWMMRGISMVTPLILWLFLKRALEVKDIKKGGFDEKVLFAT